MISNPIERINTCNSIDELKAVWIENIDGWKHRKDFKAISEAKDDAKYRFCWPVTLANAMRRYNEAVDVFDADPGIDEVNRSIGDGEKIELQMAEMVHRLLAEKWPVGEDGFKVLKRYLEWHENAEQIKFNEEILNG